MTTARALTPMLAALALGFAATGCSDRDDGMTARTDSDRYEQSGWRDDDMRYRSDRDRLDHNRMQRTTTYRQDYDGRPLNQRQGFQQAGDVNTDIGRTGGEMGSDPELRSPYSGDRYEDMGRYGNTP